MATPNEDLKNALSLASKTINFKLWINAPGYFAFSFGERAIGYEDSWTPTVWYAEIDNLADRLMDAYREYQHIMEFRKIVTDESEAKHGNTD